VSNWKEFFKTLQDYEADFQYYECHKPITAEDLYQAFRDRLLWEFREACAATGNDEMATLLQRLDYPMPREPLDDD
jgi:hypothetical protein